MDGIVKQPNKIEEIYSKLTQEQIKIIEVIWQYYFTHWEEKEFADRCISKLKLYKAVSNLGINSETLDKSIANFTGSILVENNEKNSNDPLYLLQYLGPFLTSDASKIKNLIIKCLQYFKDNVLNRGTTKVDLHQIHSALAFTDEDNRLLKVSLSVMGLHNLLSLQNEIVVFTGKSPTKLFETDSLEELFNTSLPNYDTNMPIDSLKQHFYLQNKGQVNLEEFTTKKKMFDQDKEDKGKKDISDKDIFEGFFGTYTKTSPKPLGEGGNGFVYEVIDEKKSKFALKLFKGTTTEKRERFKNEIYFCLKNSHKNIIEIIDLGHKLIKSEKWLFYVMPLYQSTLRDLIKKGIEPGTALSLFLQILDGVEAAHNKSVWHRDLKPENILYDSITKKLVVADFGIAHFTEEFLIANVNTRTNDKIANFSYASPEQRELKGNYDNRSDIFSLGLILNEMFTKSIPHGVGYRTIADIAQEYAYLDKIFDRMIQHFPEKRYQTIGHLKQEIHDNNGKQSNPITLEIESSNSINIDNFSQRVAVDDVEIGKQIKAYQSLYTLEGHPNAGSITQIAWSPDGKLLAAGFNGTDTIWIWNAFQKERYYDLSYGGQSPTSLIWFQDSKYLIVGYTDGSVKVWEVKTQKLIKKSKSKVHSKAVVQLFLVKGEARLISIGEEGDICFWPLSDDKFEASYFKGDNYKSPATYLEVKNEFIFAKGTDLWHNRPNENNRKLGIHPKNITFIVGSLDGNKALVGSENGLIRLWNLKEDHDYEPINKHNAQIVFIKYLNNNAVLSKSSDGVINIWNPASEEKETLITYENQPANQYCVGVALHPTDPNVLALLKSPNIIEVVSMSLKQQ